MSYPNSYYGVKKLLTSQILNLISSILVVIAVIMVVISGASIITGDESGVATMLIAIVIAIAVGVLHIVAYILQLVGLKQAGMDDRSFYTAFVFAIFGLALTLLSVVFYLLDVANGFGDDVAGIFNQFVSIIIAIFVINGIRNLAVAVGRNDMEGKTKTAGVILAIILGLSIAATIASLFTESIAVTITGVLSIIAAILSVVFAIVYLVLLGKAKKMLQEN